MSKFRCFPRHCKLRHFARSPATSCTFARNILQATAITAPLHNLNLPARPEIERCRLFGARERTLASGPGWPGKGSRARRPDYSTGGRTRPLQFTFRRPPAGARRFRRGRTTDPRRRGAAEAKSSRFFPDGSPRQLAPGSPSSWFDVGRSLAKTPARCQAFARHPRHIFPEKWRFRPQNHRFVAERRRLGPQPAVGGAFSSNIASP